MGTVDILFPSVSLKHLKEMLGFTLALTQNIDIAKYPEGPVVPISGSDKGRNAA